MRILLAVLVLALAPAAPAAAAHDVDYDKFRGLALGEAVTAAKKHPGAFVDSRVCSVVRIAETKDEESSTHCLCLVVRGAPTWFQEAVKAAAAAGAVTGEDLVELADTMLPQAETCEATEIDREEP